MKRLHWSVVGLLALVVLAGVTTLGGAAGTGADWFRFSTTISANPFSVGTPGIYSKNTDGRPRAVSASGREYRLGTTSDVEISAGPPAGIALGSCWSDSTNSYRIYCKESGGNLAQRTDLLAPGTIGCGGTPAAGCFTTLGASSTATFTGSLILPQTTAPAQTAEGSIVWDTNDDLLTVGDGAARKTMVDLAGTQTLTNKTLTAPVLGGTVAGTYTIGGTPTLGVNTVATSGITLTVGANVLIGSVADKLNAAMLAIASQATGDLLVANAATTFARLAIGSTGQVLTVSGGTAAWASPVVAHITGGATTAPGIATIYLVGPGQAGSASEIMLAVASRAGVARNLYCSVITAPGGADTTVFTVRKNGSDQTTTCTITGAGTSCNDTSNTFTVAAGNTLSIKAVSSSALTAGITCSLEETAA